MTLIVYSQSRCPGCETIKRQLNQADIPFVEVKIDQDAEAKAFVLSRGHRSVPVVYKDGEHVPDINSLRA